MSKLREELISSAMTFLKDPQVSNSPLAKKIEFLESKELTNEEIQEALRRSGLSDTTTPNTNTSATAQPLPTSNPSSTYPPAQTPPPYGYATYNAPPPVPQRDWRDYFVMATVTAGVGYGIYELARRYVLPLIMPPTPTALEADKKALEAEFARAQTVLDQLQKDNEELKASEEARTKKVDEALEELESVINQVKTQVAKRDEEMKLIKLQMESVKDELPVAIERNSESQQFALNDLLAELKSLKQLVSARIKTQTTIPSPPMPSSISNTKPNGGISGSASSSTSSLPISTSIPAAPTGSLNTNPPPLVSNSSEASGSTLETSSATSAAATDSTPTTASAENAPTTNDIFGSMPALSRARAGIPAWQMAKPSSESSTADSK